MNWLKIPLKIDVHNTIMKIEGINNEKDLFAFSRTLRNYQDLGLIRVPVKVKDKLSMQLMKIYKKI
ncbi:hypothetical protein [Chryseobacterium oncorhynchi]|uniref:Uncharacterized protein n=1 Tax=Chryseobacterium oncorhynchi TaxID=741074 RepID=A0A316X9V1_9FLAO|nr:hypothetical protein [Chryseobacterium oncorhynchi]PWN67630.1 hypothetical protein C1638_003295 [Chryseobacterium oncorhynchi]